MTKNPAHLKPSSKSSRKPSNAIPRSKRSLVVAVVALAVLVVGVAGFALLRPAGTSASAAQKPPVPPLYVVGTTPAANATGVTASSPITVTFSAPLSSSSPKPSITPAVPGNWTSASPTELEFVPAGPLVPGSSEKITVPGGATGALGTKHQTMIAPYTASFTVAQGSTLRLQQLLAELGYLPLNFTPASQPSSPQQEADPQVGTFAWRWPNQPPSLTSLWSPGVPNVITNGAVMSFEAQHGLPWNGAPTGTAFWTALLQAASTGAADPLPYGYVLVSKQLPETATVYQNGVVKYTTLANTGVPAAPTANGTFPVYARYTSTTMSGTNPNGTKYVDPGIPWVSYFNGGDALHGFVRASYGFPQSVGCVEMPPAHAAVVFPMTPIGTLVTVQ